METIVKPGLGMPEQTNPTQVKLNKNQSEKYDCLLPIYKDEDTTIKLVTLIEGRGRNSWNAVNERIEKQLNADYSLQKYIDALYDNFSIDEEHTSSEIVGIVSQVRRDLGLKVYSSRLKHNCENDLFLIFLVHDMYEEKEVEGKIKKVHVGYKLMFKLQPED